MDKSRRDFCKKSFTAAAGVGLVSLVPGQLSCSNPNETIVFGAIGIRSMGYANIRSFLRQKNTLCKALCDVDKTIINERAAWVEKQTGRKPDTYTDFRKLLEDKEIDAVIIGTPDHWHCLIAIMAMQAGKHVYVEKPMANSISEAMLMEKAVDRYQKVLTVNQWQRSGQHWQDAVEYIKTGKLGKVGRVKAWSYTRKDELPVVPDSPTPEGVDYDMWLGPARKRPFNKQRFHYNHRYYWDYAGGLMCDWGVHMLDFALFGLNVTTPNKVMAMGGKYSFPKDARETPDMMNVLYQYDNFMVEWEHAISLGQRKFGSSAGIVYQGENASMTIHRGGWEVIPEKTHKGEPLAEAVPFTKGGGDLDKHVANFLHCIRNNRMETNCSVKAGKDVAILAHMGNIAYRTGDILHWDKEKNQFIDNNKANELLTPNYRAPWKLPQI